MSTRQETPVRFLGQEDSLKKGRLPTPVFMGFSGGSDSKESACSVGEIWVWFLGREDPLEKDRLPTPGFMGFPGGLDGKESACNVGDLGLIPGLGRSPGGGHGNPFQYSYLENPHGERSLVGYSPWSPNKSDMTEWLSTAQNNTSSKRLRANKNKWKKKKKAKS